MQVLEARDAEEALRIVEAAEEEEQEEEEVQDSVKEDNGGGVATTTRRRPPPPPPIVVAGSLYLVADVMRLARRLAPTPARWRMDGRMPEEHNHPLSSPLRSRDGVHRGEERENVLFFFARKRNRESFSGPDRKRGQIARQKNHRMIKREYYSAGRQVYALKWRKGWCRIKRT